MRTAESILALAIWIGSAMPSIACAQTILDHADFMVSGGAGAYDQNGMNFQQNADSNGSYNTGLDFSDTRGTSFSRNGFVGTGVAQNVTLFVPSNPGLLGQFSGVKLDLWLSAETTQSSGINLWESSYAAASSYIYFTLGAPTAWTFDADVASWTSPGPPGLALTRMSISIFDLSGNGADQLIDYQEVFSGAGYSYSISDGGVLPAGSYVWELGMETTYNAFGFEQASGACYVEVTNACFNIPSPGTLFLLGAGSLIGKRRRR